MNQILHQKHLPNVSNMQNVIFMDMPKNIYILNTYVNRGLFFMFGIFGRCCVVESFKFHPELILNFLRDSEFYSKF